MASILGAILLFGIAVSTVVTVQAQYVPVWDHEREARLMDSLAGQMAAAQAELARQVANRSTAPTALPIPLAPSSGGPSLFQGSSAPGTLALQPAPGSFTLSAPQLTFAAQQGTDLFDLSESWTPVPSGTTLGNVASVDHLRLRLHNPSTLPNNGVLSLTVLDGSGAYAGKLTLTNLDEQSDFALVARVYSAASSTSPITEQLQSWKKTTPDPDFYLDALAPSLGFAAVLHGQPGTFSLRWANGLPGAEETMVYTTGGAAQIGSTGVAVPDYVRTTSSGVLVAGRSNQRFPTQAYSLEYGALLLSQPDGDAMVAPPAFGARLDGGQLQVSWSLPQVTGGPSLVGGARAAQLTVVPLGARLALHAAASRLGFTLATAHPAAWAAYFDGTLRDAGLDPAAGQYHVATTANSVTLDLYGPVAAPNDATNDIHLDYAEASLAVSLLPSG